MTGWFHRAGRVCGLYLTALLAGIGVLAGCQSTSPDGGVLKSAPAPAPLTAQERELNVKSFDQVWQTVNDRHWDPTLGGLDWQAVKVQLRPKVEEAQTMEEARAVMRDALGRLGQSHFGILAREAYDEVSEAPEAGVGEGNAGETGAVGQATDSAAATAPSQAGDGDAGLSIRIVDGAAVVAFIEPDCAAALAGVKPGWIVESVNGKPIAPVVQALQGQFQGREAADAMIVRGVERRFAGKVGDKVTGVFLDGQDHRVEKTIELDEAAGEVTQFSNLPPMHVNLVSTRLPGGIGYIRFNIFLYPAKIMPAFESAMRSFADAPGVIVDLRGNPGGIGFMANGMSGFFVDKDGLKLGEMRTRETTLNFVIFPRAQVYQGPLAILVDGLSLSTSEVMAGGLQDIGRARVFGTRTGGAALPSLIERLPNGDGFQFAVANYISASGRVLEGEGVNPDEEVPLDRATLLAGKDPVIEAAVRWIDSQASASK
ncbi:MAG: hypothetical protein IT435_14080 [Phycisphaerales bacterium]|nr:hypothetical protein [Phycisphaerales bacterium]